jgi:hypothetical protein
VALSDRRPASPGGVSRRVRSGLRRSSTEGWHFPLGGAAAAQRLVASVTPAIRARTVLPARAAVIIATSADGHRVRAVTAGPLKVIGWGGIREHLTIRARSLATDHLSAGERVGEAALTGNLPTPAAGPTRTAVRAPAGLAATGISWRLAHLL